MARRSDVKSDRRLLPIVIPAKAGIHLSASAVVDAWVPAFAGTTKLGDHA